MNTAGHLLRVTTFGESHGAGLGCVVDGVPAGVPWEAGLLARELSRRAPGQPGTSPRREPDEPEVLSGVSGGLPGVTLGTPVAILVRNRDARPRDYPEGRPDRPGHADSVWRDKYGQALGPGSGRASGRETVGRVAGGAVARMVATRLRPEVRVEAAVTRIGALGLSAEDLGRFLAATEEGVPHPQDAFPLRMPGNVSGEALEEVLRLSALGESTACQVVLALAHLPPGLGQPVFRKLRSDLASALTSVGAVTALEFGDGRDVVGNEPGGLSGGLSKGGRALVRVSVKAPASVGALAREGRHDACLGPRIAPVLEAMAWLVLADHLQWARCDRA